MTERNYFIAQFLQISLSFDYPLRRNDSESSFDFVFTFGSLHKDNSIINIAPNVEFDKKHKFLF